MTAARGRIEAAGWFAVASAALGGVAVLVPRWLFPVCGFSGVPGVMRCAHTPGWAMTAGCVAVAGGVTAAIATTRQARITGAVLAVVGNALVVAVPLVLAPVCGSEAMPCHYGTLPALVAVGAAGIACGAVSLVLFARTAAPVGDAR